MGRSLVYCAICDGPLENVYNNVDIHDRYDKKFLLEGETEVGFYLF